MFQNKPENDREASKGTRIAKLIAHAGICSRREAEKLILQGRVTHKGAVVASPAFNVVDASEICVNGNSLEQRRDIVIWRYHKPRGVISTKRDTHNRPTIYDDIPDALGHIVNVGRLDGESEGLMLFTNNGDVARELMHPKTQLERVYDVTVSGVVPPDMISKVSKGVTIDGIRYRPAGCAVMKVLPKNRVILRFTLTEGKNREIRNIADFFGLRVTRLIRISYAGIRLENLKPGHLDQVPAAILSPDIKKIIQIHSIN